MAFPINATLQTPSPQHESESEGENFKDDMDNVSDDDVDNNDDETGKKRKVSQQYIRILSVFYSGCLFFFFFCSDLRRSKPKAHRLKGLRPKGARRKLTMKSPTELQSNIKIVDVF